MNGELHPRTFPAGQCPGADAGQLPADAHPLMRWISHPNKTTCGGSWATLPRATSRIPDARRPEIRQAHRGFAAAADRTLRHGGRSRRLKDNASDGACFKSAAGGICSLLARILPPRPPARKPPMRCVRSRGAANRQGQCVRFEYRAGRGLMAVCHSRRRPIRGLWKWKPNFAKKYSK